MRIAFVGKGGAGKTTLAVLFAQFAAEQGDQVLLMDADMNLHAAELCDLAVPRERWLSEPKIRSFILKHLRGTNQRISSDDAFRKSTPPGRGSRLVFLDDPADPLLARCTVGDNALRAAAVGTYREDEIGASCYHNHLSILEQLLTHLFDGKGLVVADMVAGVDAFASTLHAQFDLLVLVVEPTIRGVEVYRQYAKLAEAAGCLDAIRVVGNKVRSPEDENFLGQHIPAEHLFGYVPESDYLRSRDQQGGALQVSVLESPGRSVLNRLWQELKAIPYEPQKRLEKIWSLHERYVAQGFIRERFGDLTSQIDPTFQYERL